MVIWHFSLLSIACSDPRGGLRCRLSQGLRDAWVWCSAWLKLRQGGMTSLGSHNRGQSLVIDVDPSNIIDPW